MRWLLHYIDDTKDEWWEMQENGNACKRESKGGEQGFGWADGSDSNSVGNGT